MFQCASSKVTRGKSAASLSITVIGPEDAAFLDLRSFKPSIEGIHRSTGEVDDLVVLGATKAAPLPR